MARPLRIQFGGAVYHLLVRAPQRQSLFRDDLDRQQYLDLLGQYKERFRYAVYGFALLRREVHLLLETPQANISKMMQCLGTSYTQYFNRRHRRSGALFVGRYKSFLVDKDTYLAEVTRYIHRAHFRPGLNGRLRRDYPWSSYRAYLGREHSLLLDTAGVLGKFGARPELQKRNYRDYVESGGRKNPYPAPIISQQIVGPVEFAQKIVSQYQWLTIDGETTALRKAETILRALSLSLGPEEFLRSKEKKGKALLRHVAMYVIRRQTLLPLRAIGAMLGVKASAVALAIVRLEKRLKQGNAPPLVSALLKSASFVATPVMEEPAFQGRGATTKEKDQKIDANRS
jgi:putative transposase